MLATEIGLHDNIGNTALMYAVMFGESNTKAIEFLATRETLMRNNAGETALMMARPEFFTYL